VFEEDFIYGGATSKFAPNFSGLFDANLMFSGIENRSLEDLERTMDTINTAKQKGLLKLEHDRVRSVTDLPVQLITNNILKLDFPRTSEENIYFDTTNTNELYSSKDGARTIVNTNEGFLGIKAFRHNLIAFDPRPPVTFSEETNPYFPTFNPIYNQKSFDDLLEYIYTAIYPSDNIPVFPNFTVGNFVIDGAKYNPLYDFRNFRTFGFYQSFNDDAINEKLFLSDPMSLYVPSIRVGRMVNIGDDHYQVKRDFNNTGPIFTNITSDGTIQKVKPSGIIFKRVSEELYDLNPSLQVTI